MHNLQHLVRQVASKGVALTQKAEDATAAEARIKLELTETNRLLDRKDDVLRALHQLQIKAQAKNKGVYEQLLTSLVREVMPGKTDEVVLTSNMRNNRASLDFDVSVDGHLENISQSKGGSINNIIAMGLRFIVLARHPNRRVLLLDETDCHLRSEYIPAFAAVMQQMAHRLGIQVLYISHHPTEMFTGYGRVLELIKTGKQVHCRIASEELAAPEEYEAPESALRYLRLKNFCQHTNTLVDLSPGLNVITGDVDLGKSKMIQAIVDLSENNGTEANIQHTKPYFEVELGLEQGMSLLWRYNRTGSKKTLVELRDEQGALVETSTDGTGPSEWLHTYLAMSPVNGENIHFHSQKRPHYLLDSQEYSSIERAQMLPLGRESRDVMKMIQEFNSRVSSARQNRTRLERDLNVQRNLLAAMSLIIENPIDPIALHDHCDQLLAHHADVQALGKKIDGMETAEAAVELYQTALEALERQVIVPVELMVTEPLERCISIITRSDKQNEVLGRLQSLKPMPKAPEVRDLSGIIKLGSRLKNLELAQSALQALHGIEPLPALEIADRSTMKHCVDSLMDLEARLNQLLNDVKKAVENTRQANEAKHEFIKSMGGECPTCFQPMQEGANEHAHG